MKNDFSLVSSVFMRFVRGGIASAFGSMAVIIPSIGVVKTFTDIKMLLSALAVSGLMGLISGVVLAGDKYFRSTPVGDENMAQSLAQ